MQAEWPRAIEELTSFPHIEEAAVLSTCNRMELYVVALSWHRVCKVLVFINMPLHAIMPIECFVASMSSLNGTHARSRCMQGVREVEEWMSQTSGIPLEELRPHMFLLRDRDATSHLMR